MYMYNIWVKINTGLNVYKRKLVLLCISLEIMWKMVMFYTFFKYWKIKMAIEISINKNLNHLIIHMKQYLINIGIWKLFWCFVL